MAGNFLLLSITQSEAFDLQFDGFFLGSMTAVQHSENNAPTNYEFLGKCLKNKTSDKEIINTKREDLPRHLYIELDMSRFKGNWLRVLQNAVWVDRLQRPDHFPLKSLCPDAKLAWNRKDNLQALLDQLTQGPVSLEIYYVAGSRV